MFFCGVMHKVACVSALSYPGIINDCPMISSSNACAVAPNPSKERIASANTGQKSRHHDGAVLCSNQYFGKNGRGSKIRTCDPLVPNQMRYQAALYPDPLISRGVSAFGVGVKSEEFKSNPRLVERGPTGQSNSGLHRTLVPSPLDLIFRETAQETALAWCLHNQPRIKFLGT